MLRKRWSGWCLLPLVALALLPTTVRADTLTDSIKVTPHGGRVLENVHVTPIFWGGWWNTNPEGVALRGYFEGFFLDLFADGRFMKNLDNEYSLSGHRIGKGTLDRRLVIEAKPPATVSRQDIRNGLTDLVSGGWLPTPDASRLYFFFLPPGTVWDQGEGAHSFHNSYAPNPAGPWYVYAACFYHNPILMTGDVSHELAEAVTDPVRFDGKMAWFDDNLGSDIGEIADIPVNLWLAGTIHNDDLWDTLEYQGRYYLVQKVWC
jgi:hypothetical protein